MAIVCNKIVGNCSNLFQKNVVGNTFSFNSGLLPAFGGVTTVVPCRGKRILAKPKLKYPLWLLKKEHSAYDENLTRENTDFVKQVSHDKFGPPAIVSGLITYKSPLKNAPPIHGEWTPKTRRCGLITRKIGQYPMWDKDGDIIWSTLLQVVDNHVVKYTPPEEYDPPKKPPTYRGQLNMKKYGCLLVGAESQDPQKFTREYCGLFAEAGLPPKKILGRFLISPNAAIQPGTPLFANHFQTGDIVDVVGRTIDRGFQGVMKRWGFKGMPASHGVTKTHRRGGNVGGGGEKGRIWPGTKIPGYMGNRIRYLRGLKIWRINTKYNVLYVQGLAVPGTTNSLVYLYDTVLPLRKKKEPPINFPTYFPSENDQLPEDIYDDEVHHFGAPSIKYDA